MAVTAQTPRNVSTATAGATVFPYSFKITQASDLLVTVDGVTKTLNVDYTVSGVGIDAGGNVTFAVAMAGGETVLRKRNMAFQRGTDFQNLGDLRSSTLNNDQDAPILMMQQLADDLTLTLRLAPDAAGFSLTLPEPIPLRPLVVNSAGTAFEMGDTTLTGDMLLRPTLANTSTGLGLALTGTAASAAFNQVSTGQHFGQNGARIHRLNDRVLLGSATVNDGLFPNVAKDWLSAYQESIGLGAGTLLSAQVAVLNGTNPNSAVPILAGVQSQYFTSAGTTGLGIAAYALANNSTTNNDVWAFYGEGRRASGVSAEAYGGELDCSALSATISGDPYTYGDVGGLILASGGEYPLAGQFDTSFGLALYGNGSKFKQGIVFRGDSLTDLGGGVKEAIALPSGALIRQWTAAATPASYLYFATTTAAGSASLQLANGNMKIVETSAGAEQFRVNITTSAVNYPSVSSSLTGAGVQYGANGTDANIDVLAAPKGTGVFGTTYAATVATTPGSFSANRIVPVRCNGTLVYLAGMNAAW